MATLPLNDIVNVIVQISPVAAARSGFNLGLIIGATNVIPPGERVRLYSNLTALIEDGFKSSDPEYIAAQLYFSQNPKPNRVAIGRWDNSEPGETVTDAVTACRVKNTDWYACIICGANKQNILDTAGYIEVAEPKSVFFYTTADADVKAGTEGNVMDILKKLSYMRTLGQYSATADAAAAIMGYAMGANTGLANSAYTLAYKREVGVAPDDLTLTEITTIKGQNGNVYINRGNTYNLFEQGIMANGTHFDEVINLDKLANDIQLAVLDLLTGVTKIPQTEDGIAMIVNAINGPCKDAVNKGFIAPGVWNAPGILSLQTGDTLSQGYLILSESIDDQDEAARSARIAPPIYVPIKLAGAIEFVTIEILVNR